MIILRFVRNSQQLTGAISVSYNSSLQDKDNLDENFHLSLPIGLNTYLERKLFYSFDAKKWTLNELVFFAKNNNLCLSLVKDNVVIKRYGACRKELPIEIEINTQILVNP